MPTQPFTQWRDLTNRRQAGVAFPEAPPQPTRVRLALQAPAAQETFDATVDAVADVATAGTETSVTLSFLPPAASNSVAGLAVSVARTLTTPAPTTTDVLGLASSVTDGLPASLADVAVASHIVKLGLEPSVPAANVPTLGFSVDSPAIAFVAAISNVSVAGLSTAAATLPLSATTANVTVQRFAPVPKTSYSVSLGSSTVTGYVVTASAGKLYLVDLANIGVAGRDVTISAVSGPSTAVHSPARDGFASDGVAVALGLELR